jgi:hypothetical protein
MYGDEIYRLNERNDKLRKQNVDMNEKNEELKDGQQMFLIKMMAGSVVLGVILVYVVGYFVVDRMRLNKDIKIMISFTN